MEHNSSISPRRFKNRLSHETWRVCVLYCTVSTVFQENEEHRNNTMMCVCQLPSVHVYLLPSFFLPGISRHWRARHIHTRWLSALTSYRFCETTTAATMVQSTKEGKERGSIAAASSLSCIIVIIHWQRRNTQNQQYRCYILCLYLYHEPDPYTVMIGPCMHNIDHTVYSMNLDHSMMLLLLQ